MEQIKPRFEFRVWGGHVDDGAALLRSLANESGIPGHSSETYVIALTRDDVNAKIRAGLMDVKVLHDVAEGCERWFPWTKAEFPLAAALVEAVLPRLGVPAANLERKSYGFEQFIDELVASRPELHAVVVDKEREQYRIEGCLAEVTEVAINHHRTQTLAIESVELEALVELRRRLGMNELRNVNYPAALKEALGLALDDVR